MKKIKNIFKKMNTTENEIVNEQNAQPEENQTGENAENTQINEEKQTQSVDDYQVKIAELNDKYLRLYSEFDNYRKRTSKEKIDLMKTAGEDIFKSLLPVLDDFERAIKSNVDIKDIEVIKEGFNLIYHKLKNNLTQKGLEEMKSLGEAFDADIHEAITNIPAPTEELKGKVVDELEKGYCLNGKIIRFAKVVIGQ